MSRWITTLLQVSALTVLVILTGQLDRAGTPNKTVTINYNGLQWTTETTVNDVAELLVTYWGAYDNWKIDPAPDTSLTNGMTIVVADQQTQKLNATVAKNLQTRQVALAQATKPPPPKVSEVRAGLATWYRFGDKLTTASRKYPKGTKLRVVAVNSGKSVDVVVNDYGPSITTGIDLDLNKPAFAAIAPLGAGKIKVKYYKI